ncbi:MAG: cation transporter [Bacteroidales bacterium]
MKSGILFLATILVVSLATTSCGSKGKKAEQAEVIEVITEDVHLHYIQVGVEGMTCEGCENTVKGAIENVAGVNSATATHLEAYAIAGYAGEEPDTTALREAITATGYTVTGFKLLGHDLPKKE